MKIIHIARNKEGHVLTVRREAVDGYEGSTRRGSFFPYNHIIWGKNTPTMKVEVYTNLIGSSWHADFCIDEHVVTWDDEDGNVIDIDTFLENRLTRLESLVDGFQFSGIFAVGEWAFVYAGTEDIREEFPRIKEFCLDNGAVGLIAAVQERDGWVLRGGESGPYILMSDVLAEFPGFNDIILSTEVK